MIFRSAEAKADLEGSWNRPDRPFFATGACHILCAAFLESDGGSGYRPIYLQPRPGFRGGHVLASNGETVFDYHGSTRAEAYFGHLFRKMRRLFPGWDAEVIRLDESPAGHAFCHRYQHRRPDQFWADPWPRAFSYVSRLHPSRKATAPMLHSN